jgi:hypothetical protein
MEHPVLQQLDSDIKAQVRTPDTDSTASLRVKASGLSAPKDTYSWPLFVRSLQEMNLCQHV